MFGMLSKLAKATVGVVVHTPVALVADALTLGRAATDNGKPYTAQALSSVLKNVKDSVK